MGETVLHGIYISHKLTCIVLFFRLGCNAIGDKGADYIGQAVTANASQSVVQILYVLYTVCMHDEYSGPWINLGTAKKLYWRWSLNYTKG